jgi:hypothetical protein
VGNYRLVMVALICIGPQGSQLRADSIDSQLQREILAGWAELEKGDNAQTAIDLSVTREELEGPRKGKQSGMYRYRCNGQARRITSEAGKIDEAVRNSQYLFVVTRESDAIPWRLRFIETDLQSVNAQELQAATFAADLIAPTSAVLLGSARQLLPSSLVGDPKFKMTKVQHLPSGLVKVYYQYELINGEFDCDPAAHYMIRAGRSSEKGPTLEYTMTHQRQIRPGAGSGQVVAERLAVEVVGNPVRLGGHSKVETNYSYPDVRKTKDLDEERFRLTAYGLPEPAGVQWPKRTSRWWWIAAGAVTALLLAAGFRYLYRRRAKANPVVV